MARLPFTPLKFCKSVSTIDVYSRACLKKEGIIYPLNDSIKSERRRRAGNNYQNVRYASCEFFNGNTARFRTTA